MTNNQCPLGEHCNQTIEALAWAEAILKGQDLIKSQAAEIERLRDELKRSLESLEGLLWAWNELSRAVPLLHNEPSAKSARAIVAELKGGKDE